MITYTTIVIRNKNSQSVYVKSADMTMFDAALYIENFLASCSNRLELTVSISFN